MSDDDQDAEYAMSQELADLMVEAVELGLGCIGDGDNTPFLMFIGDEGERQLMNCETSPPAPELGVQLARDYVARSKGSLRLFAIVYDGLITIDGVKSDAVIVEAGERGGTYDVAMSQRYVPKKRSPGLKKVGTRTLQKTARLMSE